MSEQVESQTTEAELIPALKRKGWRLSRKLDTIDLPVGQAQIIEVPGWIGSKRFKVVAQQDGTISVSQVTSE
jgi:hypothetical protein